MTNQDHLLIVTPMELSLPILAICLLASFVGVYVGMPYLMDLLEKMQLVDVPKQLSNHSIPTLRGGGALIVDVMLIGMIAIAWAVTDQITTHWPIFVAIACVALISFYDDIKSVPAKFRLASHMIAVAVGIYAIEYAGYQFGVEYHPWVERVFLFFFWVWFINLFNFMDGIDGITGTETVSIALGIAIVGAIIAIEVSFIYYAVIIIGACLAFLKYNWHPARIFIGDVGSVALGYTLGWLLIILYLKGFYYIVWILGAYYFMDATYTLCKRIVNGEPFWKAHSQHFYQIAVRKGNTHDTVVKWIALCNAFLIVVAVACAFKPQWWPVWFMLSNMAAFGLLVRMVWKTS